MQTHPKIDFLEHQIRSEVQSGALAETRKCRLKQIWLIGAAALLAVIVKLATHYWSEWGILNLLAASLLAYPLYYWWRLGKMEERLLKERSDFLEKLSHELKIADKDEAIDPIKVIRQRCGSIRLLFQRDDGDYEVGVIAPGYHYFGESPRACKIGPIVGSLTVNHRDVTFDQPRILRKDDDVKIRARQPTPYLVCPSKEAP